MNEINESEYLLSQATFPAVQKLLKQHIAYLNIADDHSAIKSNTVVPGKSSAAAAAPPAATVTKVADVPPPPAVSAPVAEVPAPTHTPPTPSTAPVPPRASILSVKGPSTNFIPIESFSWDQGEYGTPTVSIFVDLPGVGAIKDNVEFSSTKSSFDLKVIGLDGKNYRLLKDNLDKDIIVNESKIIVKKDKIVIKLKKVKGDYSYENWTNLTSKKRRDSASEADKKKNPMGGIMDMMKDMYVSGL